MKNRLQKKITPVQLRTLHDRLLPKVVNGAQLHKLILNKVSNSFLTKEGKDKGRKLYSESELMKGQFTT